MTTRRFTLPKRSRLTGKTEFTAVIRRPRFRFRAECLQILAAPNTLGRARLGVVVGRRYDRRSTRRNLFKRTAREEFRRTQQSLAGLDVVVRAGRPVSRTLLQEELSRGLERLATVAVRNEEPAKPKSAPARRGLAVRMATGLIRGYRLLASPLLGARCRFYPSCSSYALEAIATWGLWKGSGLTVRRLVKCQPFHPGGYDPVPGALVD